MIWQSRHDREVERLETLYSIGVPDGCRMRGGVFVLACFLALALVLGILRLTGVI